MFFYELNKRILHQSGVTGQILFNAIYQSEMPVSQSVFFQPISNPKESMFRAFSIVGAPIMLSIFAVGCALASLVSGLQSLIHLATKNTDEASNKTIDSILTATVALVSLVAAVVSPVINLIDLLGSSLKKTSCDNSTHEDNEASVTQHL